MKSPCLILHEFRTAPPQRTETYLPFCLKVRRALNVLELPYTVNLLKGPGQMNALNPLGQAPALSIDSEVVGDSTQILARLEELAPKPLHRGLSEGQRAEALLWEELADSTLNGFLSAARWADDDNWPRTKTVLFGRMPWLARQWVLPRLRARIVQRLVARDIWRGGPVACWARLEELLDQLEARAPEHGYWIAETPSAADFSIFGQLQNLRSELTPRQANSVQSRPRLLAYLQRVDRCSRAGGG